MTTMPYALQVRDALMEPVRMLQAATHFRQEADGAWAMCEPNERGAVQMRLMQVPPQQLRLDLLARERDGRADRGGGACGKICSSIALRSETQSLSAVVAQGVGSGGVATPDAPRWANTFETPGCTARLGQLTDHGNAITQRRSGV